MMLRPGRCCHLLIAALMLVPGLGSWAAENGADARADMVRMVQLEALMLSPETGIAEVDPKVLEAMRQVPRHAFVPEAATSPYAYRNHPLPVGHDQNVAAPLLIALMTHLMTLQPGDVVYETGTGAGYHAAVLSHLVARVYSVEVVEPLAEQAGRVLGGVGLRQRFRPCRRRLLRLGERRDRSMRSWSRRRSITCRRPCSISSSAAVVW